MEHNQVATTTSQTTAVSIYSDANVFEQAQRICKMLCSSTLVPKEYQGNISNTLIAYEISVRTGMSPFMVMQNLDIIQGRPSWNSKYVISALNSCGRFAPLKFEYTDLGVKTVQYTTTEWANGQKQKKQASIQVHDRKCVAYTTDVNGNVVHGPAVTIEMAVKEGWYTKSDSKWPHMPELMLSYRAAKFFGNLYAPDVLMGMHTSDEVTDMTSAGLPAEKSQVHTNYAPIQVLNEKVAPETVQSNAVDASESKATATYPVDDDDVI